MKQMMAVALTATLSAALAALSVPGDAQETPQPRTVEPFATTFARSSAALLDRLGEVEGGRPAVGLADAATRADLTALEQAMTHFGTPDFPVDGLTSFDAVCGTLNRLSVRYALDGAGALRRPGPPPTSPTAIADLTARLSQVQTANAVRFQDELLILVPANMRCMAAHLPALAQFMAALPPEQLTPVRINGARQMQHGLASTLAGLLMSARDPAIRRANQLRGLRAATDAITAYARQLSPTQRADLRRSIASLGRSTDAEVVTAERQIDSVLADATCVELCLLP